MALVFQDNFSNTTSNVDLVDQVPDVMGTDWLNLFNDTGIGTVIWGLPSDDNVGASNNDGDKGILLHANYGTVGSASLDAELGFANKRDESGKIALIVARYIDGSNYIAVTIGLHTDDKVKLYKVVAGTPTLLATSTNAPSGGDSIKLELRGMTWKVYIGGSQVISVTEAALALRGKTAFGLGDVHEDFSNADVNTFLVWSQVIVTEVIFNELTGDIGQLTGIINGLLVPKGPLVGIINQLTSTINGIAIIGGPLVGVIAQLTGTINGVSKLFVGTLDGILDQLTGVFMGDADVVGPLIGNIIQLSGNIQGNAPPAGPFDGIINQLAGSIFGAGSIVLANVNLTLTLSEVTDDRLTWYDAPPTPGTWTFKPIIKPS